MPRHVAARVVPTYKVLVKQRGVAFGETIDRYEKYRFKFKPLDILHIKNSHIIVGRPS
jgi:hypothetical protein